MPSRLLLLIALTLPLTTTTTISAATGNGEWLARVPATDRDRLNPIPADPANIAAGAQLYQRHCASCHGRQAEGTHRRPSLLTPRVHDATGGELQWLLRNGSLKHGMPSWASLPETQRWQLVRYLHSLPVAPREDAAP